MPYSGKLSVQLLTRLGILLALAVVLRLVENMFPPLLSIPGARLGLANVITMLVLYRYGTEQTAVFLLARILLVGLLSTGLMSSGFFIGLGGAIFSFFAMSKAYEKDWFSPLGLGLLGAAFHNAGQLIVAIQLLEAPVLLHYLPVLLLVGIPTGLLTGALTKLLLARLPE